MIKLTQGGCVALMFAATYVGADLVKKMQHAADDTARLSGLQMIAGSTATGSLSAAVDFTIADAITGVRYIGDLRIPRERPAFITDVSSGAWILS